MYFSKEIYNNFSDLEFFELKLPKIVRKISIYVIVCYSMRLFSNPKQNSLASIILK